MDENSFLRGCLRDWNDNPTQVTILAGFNLLVIKRNLHGPVFFPVPWLAMWHVINVKRLSIHIELVYNVQVIIVVVVVVVVCCCCQRRRRCCCHNPGRHRRRRRHDHEKVDPSGGWGSFKFSFCVMSRRSSWSTVLMELERDQRLRIFTSFRFTDPSGAMKLILIFVTNFSVGGSSGYLSPHVILIWYIRFSNGVRGGPMIIPFQRVNIMSSSSSKPHEIVPSPAPFCPDSSSSRRTKLRGTLAWDGAAIVAVTDHSGILLSNQSFLQKILDLKQTG